MALLDQIKNICSQNDIKPSRSKGQNFLIDEDTYDNVVKYADINKDDTVLEVGPGLGFLTERLAKKAKKVVAVELDDKIAFFLENKFKNTNVEIVNEDILELRITNYELRKNEYKIVANLPYNITSFFLREFISADIFPNSMTLMLQKEVAERIVASPGAMSVLAISIQYYADAKILEYVGKEKFWPRPEVDSAIIKIDLKTNLRRDVDKEKEFFRLVKIGFSSRRKMLKNNLMSGYHINQEIANNKLKEAGLNEKVRAQDLSLTEWEKLFVQLG